MLVEKLYTSLYSSRELRRKEKRLQKSERWDIKLTRVLNLHHYLYLKQNIFNIVDLQTRKICLVLAACPSLYKSFETN